MEKVYDVIIIGSGPSGMSCAIYSRLFNLDTLIIESLTPGGAMVNTETISNYPGYEKVDGFTLSMNMYEQMIKLNTTYVKQLVTSIEKVDNNLFKVSGNKTYYTKTVTIATGTTFKTLGLKNESKYFYKGISWCAICDGPLYNNRVVSVVGGGNSALSSALTLSKIAKTVYLIHRRNEFRGSKSLFEEVLKTSNIKILTNYEIVDMFGEDVLKNLKLKSNITNEEIIIDTDCLFECIGRIPNTEFIKDFIQLNEDGYIICDNSLKTSMDNVFSCGDVIDKKVRQIVTAVSDGAICAINCNNIIISLGK